MPVRQPPGRSGVGCAIGVIGPIRSSLASSTACTPSITAVTSRGSPRGGLRSVWRNSLLHSAARCPCRTAPASIRPRSSLGSWPAGSSRGSSTPSPTARRRRTSRSPCPRRTSPACCTWATRSTAPCRTTLVRYHRMLGRRAKWIFGTDHAGHRHPEAGRAPAPRAEGTSREEIGREAFVERVWRWRRQYGGTITEPVPAPGRLAGLRRRALHARRALRDGGAEGLRRPVRQGRDLPRQLPRQLGPGQPLGDLRPRGRGARGRGHALPRRLPAGGRVRGGGGRHRAPGDDAGRHRRRRASRRRPLPPPRRPRRRSCRSSAGACRSSPTSTSSPSSARAA